jgi:hypothetical protein
MAATWQNEPTEAVVKQANPVAFPK